MKNYHKIAIVALGMLLIACAEKFDITLIPSTVVPSLKEYYLTIGQKEYNFPSTEFSANTTVNSSGVWNFVGMDSWLTISPAQGSGGTSAVTLKAAANSITESRISIFELQSPANDEGWYSTYTITASQKATEAYIKVNNTTSETYTGAVSFDGKSNSKDFFVDSNCEYEIECSGNWMSVSEPATVSDIRERITVSVDENTTSQQREGTVTLSYSYDGETVATEIRVYQKPANITASADALSFTYVGGNGVVSFNSEATWSAYTNDSFIELIADDSTTFNVEKGSIITGNAGTGTFGITVAKNPSKNGRVGAIYITINDTDIIELPVEQGNVTLSVPEMYHTLSFTSSLPERKAISVASNATYTVTSNAEWITFSNNNDGTVEIIADDNPSISNRSTYVYVTSSEDGTLYQEISVSQSGKTFELYTPDNSNLNFGRAGSTQNIVIYTNAKWSATTTSDWVTIENKSGIPENIEYITIPVTVTDNNLSQYRSGKIEIIMEGNSTPIVVDVYQDPVETEIYDSTVRFSSKQDTTSVYFYTNAPWTATTDSNWITITPASGAPKGTGREQFILEISVTENTSTTDGRTGYVYINGTDNYFTINQDCGSLSLSSNNKYFGNGADSTYITIYTTGKWNATADSDWITVTPGSGTPDKYDESRMLVSVSANKSSNKRNGKVTVTMNDAIQELNIEQDGGSLSVSRSSISFKNVADSASVTLSVTGEWSAKATADWLTITPNNGTPDKYGEAKFMVYATANSSANPRKDTIIVTMYDVTKKIAVEQSGAYMTVSTDSLSFGHYASSKSITLNTNGLWSAVSDSDWIITETEGDKLTISVTDNNSTGTRDGKVTIYMYDGSWTIKVHQQASSISLDREILSFSHSSGTQEFKIYTNTFWNIEVDPPQGWITVDQTSGGSDDSWNNGYWIKVTVTDNDENQERTGKIIVSTKNEVKTLTVKQEQKYLEIESPALDFTASGGKSTISVTKATDEYKAYSDQDWVTVTKDNWYDRVSVQVLFNSSRYERTATVTIENDYNKSYKLTLTQQGRTISVGEAGAELFAKGGSATTAVTVDGDFTVSTPSGSWLTATHQEGTNKITVTATENETGAERTEYVTVSLANQPEGEEVLSEKFAVKQYPYTNKINLEGFEGTDKDVTVAKGKGFSIKITTYTSDKDYNKQNGGVNTTVNGYGDDKGKDKNGNGNITINGYGDDKNYNN